MARKLNMAMTIRRLELFIILYLILKIAKLIIYLQDYYPNLVINDSINFLRHSKQHHPHRPFMLVMGFPSPHGPEDSAPEYSNMFFNVTSHQ